jgi:large subunit ribosomal protein L15
MVKNMPDHFGRHGFKRPQSVIKKDKTINVGQLEEAFPGKSDIDLGKEGFSKLLGGGSLNKKMKIKVNSASEKAIEKIKEKGGEITLPEIPKEPVVEEEQLKEK